MNFRELREKIGISTKEASVYLGVSEHALYNYENSYRMPSLDILKKMCLLYDVNLTKIVNIYDLHKKKYEMKKN